MTAGGHRIQLRPEGREPKASRSPSSLALGLGPRGSGREGVSVMDDTNGQVRRRGPERRISQPTSTYIVSWDLPRLTAFSVEAVNYAGEGPCRTAQDLTVPGRS